MFSLKSDSLPSSSITERIPFPLGMLSITYPSQTKDFVVSDKEAHNSTPSPVLSQRDSSIKEHALISDRIKHVTIKCFSFLNICIIL